MPGILTTMALLGPYVGRSLQIRGSRAQTAGHGPPGLWLAEIESGRGRGSGQIEPRQGVAHLCRYAEHLDHMLTEPALPRFAADENRAVDLAIAEQALVISQAHGHFVGDGVQGLGYVDVDGFSRRIAGLD